MEEQSGWITDLFKEHLNHGEGYNPDCSFCKHYKKQRDYSDLSAEKIREFLYDMTYGQSQLRTMKFSMGVGAQKVFDDAMKQAVDSYPVESYKTYILDASSYNDTSLVDIMKPEQIKYNILMNELENKINKDI